MRQALKDPLLILLLFMGALLVFANLGNSYLWQDEAETAFISKNLLKFGLPLASDGTNQPQTMEIYKQSAPANWQSLPYRYAPWLPFYITAASFKVFGMNAFAARLPFAIIGFFSFILVWFLAKEIFNDKKVSILAVLFTVMSIPYILHLRQCHWFALSAFLSLWLLLAYIHMLNGRGHSGIEFAIAGILLFHSNHGIFIPLFLGIALHFLIFGRQKLKITSLILPGSLIAILCLPFLFFLTSLEFAAKLNSLHLRHQIEFYFRMINKWVFPWVAFLGIWFFTCVRTRRFKGFLKGLPMNTYLLLFVIFTTIIFLILPKVRSFRYINHLIPLLFILQARIVVGWMKFSKPLAVVGIVTLLFTNIFTMGAPFRKPLQSLMVEYIGEITHDYDGPVEGIVKYLKARARPGDTVKINYGDLPVMFYTDLKVDNRTFTEHQSYPEWIVYRHDWVTPAFFETDYGKKVLTRYERIVLDYPDISWHNRPDPSEHKFRTVTNAPRLVIYKRKDEKAKKVF